MRIKTNCIVALVATSSSVQAFNSNSKSRRTQRTKLQADTMSRPGFAGPMSQQSSSSFPQQQSTGGSLARGSSSFGNDGSSSSSSFGQQQDNGSSFGQQQNNGSSFGQQNNGAAFGDASSFKNTQFPRAISDASIEEFRAVSRILASSSLNEIVPSGA
jgi:hypothetical protein